MTITDLLQEIDHLPTDEKLQLVQHILDSLEIQQHQSQDRTEWHQFVRETYGALRDTPIQRWEQGNYEERESLS